METGMDWTDRLIASVEAYPVLYDKTLKEYSNPDLKSLAWADVCEELVPQWEEMTPEQKKIREKEVHQKWQNLRTCFRREYNEQKRELTNQQTARPRRRKYIFYDQLRFLLPTIEETDCATNNTNRSMCGTSASVSDSSILDMGDSNDIKEETVEVPVETQAEVPSHYQQSSRPLRGRLNKRPISCRKPFVKFPKIDQQRNEELDEDKLFLMSLLPSLKRLDIDQKTELKIDMLRLVQRFHHESVQD